MEHGPVYSPAKELVSRNADISHVERDDELFYSPSPRNDLLGRENKRGLETPGRLGMKAGFGKRSEKETSRWASVHDALHLVDATNDMAFVTKNSLALKDAHAKEAQTVPFKAIHSPLMDHRGSEETKKKTSSGIVPGAGRPRAQQLDNVVNAATGSIFSVNSSRGRGTDAEACGYDSPSSFDFNKTGVYQAAVGTVKQTPSKWDNAEKWLSASDQTPGSAKAGSKSKSEPLQSHIVANQGGAKLSKKALFSNPGAAGREAGTRSGTAGHVSNATNAAVHQGGLDASLSSSSCDSSGERDDQLSEQSVPKKLDLNAAKDRTNAGVEARGGGPQARFAFLRAGTPMFSAVAVDRYPLNDLHGHDYSDDKDGSIVSPDVTDDKTALRTAKPISESRKDYHDSPTRSKDPGIMNPMPPSDSSVGVTSSPGLHKRGTVSTRDMGTEMTPITSVEPSRTATPVITTPNIGSPINSAGPSTPDRMIVPTYIPKSVYKANNCNSSTCTAAGLTNHGSGDHHRHHNSYDNNVATTTTMTTTTRRSIRSPISKVISGRELQTKTRQEILALGTQLGKANIAAWVTKEEEEADAAKALKASMDLEDMRKSLLAARAASWEEAERAKYAVRYKREDAKIQAWENHEKAKAEAEMRRFEVKVEQIWSHANEKLLTKLAATHRQAEDLRVALEAQRIEQITNAMSQAQQIRTTGKKHKKFFSRCCWR